MSVFGKKEMVDALAAQFGLSKVKASNMYDFVMSTASNEIAKGNNVALRGIGTLKVKNMVARETVSFGKKVSLPARKRVVLTSKVVKA